MRHHRLLFLWRGLAVAVTAVVASWGARCVSAAEPANAVSFHDEPGQLVIRIKDRDVATYVYADPKIPRPYFAHIREPGGIRLTRNHPPIEGQDATDHPTYHPGMALAFGDLGGVDFWRNQGRVVQEGFVKTPHSVPGGGSFSVRNRYEADDGTVICHEVCRRTVLVRPQGYFLLWDSTFSSTRPFHFGDQEEMGLGLRVATPIVVKSRRGGRLQNAAGGINEKAIWGKTSQWCDYAGPIDDKFVGIAVMPHPDNFRQCWWHVRDYGFMGANPFGRAAFRAGPPSKVVVEPGDSLRLRFGILVHASSTAADLDLASDYDDYLEIAASHAAPN